MRAIRYGGGRQAGATESMRAAIDEEAVLLNRIAPTCAVCGHRVARIMARPCVERAGYEFRVECHGQVEEGIIGRAIFEAMPTAGDPWDAVKPGIAFRDEAVRRGLIPADDLPGLPAPPA